MRDILKISTELVKTILPDVPIFEDSCFWVAPHKSSIGMDRYYLVSGYNDPSRTARAVGNFDTFLRLMDEYFTGKGWEIRKELNNYRLLLYVCIEVAPFGAKRDKEFHSMDYSNSLIAVHLAAGEFMNKNSVRE